jgi:hypothetical protein
MAVEHWMNGLKSCTVYMGHARFLTSREIVVGDQVLTSEKVFINVGGRASVPPFPGLDEVEYLTNSSIMQIDSLPEHLVIVGGSYVGLEFAQIYRRFGSAVTVVVHVAGLVRERTIAFADFHRLPGDTPQLDTNLQQEEIVTAVELPQQGFAANYTYLKIRDRLSYAFALVSIAAALELERRPDQRSPSGAWRRCAQAVAGHGGRIGAARQRRRSGGFHAHGGRAVARRQGTRAQFL